MAIYHFSAQVISRSKGQSAIASASYRSGEELEDERTGESKYYVRNVQPETMILSPSHAPNWVQDRNRLWNEVEKSETRKNSQLAREINVALPKELTNDQQTELIKHYVQTEFVNKGMVADIAIHRDDKENPHAHIMLTTREISEEGFTVKNRGWNDRELLTQWREQWAEHTNKALEKEGIQERISHLSHEARGLEQMPTVHLGHVAHEMEKRGVQSDRGNINRERNEYNALVVDLQKYREEKKALEQERARQQEEKQKAEKFNTAAERVDLQHASKLLKVEPSLTNIAQRREQLDKWEERINHGEQYLRWKDDKIREASDHFKWIHSFENKLQEAQQRMESINWLNPLKLKENRMTKDRAEQDIASAKSEIKYHDEKLNDHREKLGFNNETELNQIKAKKEIERPGLLEKNKESRKAIRFERDVLQKAENAHKNAFVRQVASLYPERPEMRYISFKTANDIVNVISKYGNGKPVPIESIEKTVKNRKQEIQRLQEAISRVDQTERRLQRVENYLTDFEKHQAVVEKYENNPFLKGKMLVSKSSKREFEKAVSARNNYQSRMQSEGVSGRDDFTKQVEQLGKMQAEVPQHQKQIDFQGKGLSMLEAVLGGIKLAQYGMSMDQSRQERPKGKSKFKQTSRGLER